MSRHCNDTCWQQCNSGCNSGSSTSSCSLSVILTSVIDRFLGLGAVNFLYDELLYNELTDNFQLILSDTHQKRELVIDNETDEPIYVSFNGVDVHDHITSWSTARYEFGEYFRYFGGSVWVCYSDSAPTKGWVAVTARY